MYAAFPASAHLLFPLTPDHEHLVQRLAMKDVITELVETFNAALTASRAEQELFLAKGVPKKSPALV